MRGAKHEGRHAVTCMAVCAFNHTKIVQCKKNKHSAEENCNTDDVMDTTPRSANKNLALLHV
jgi:hypothetical protein